MAGPPVRERYNAKARGSVAGGDSHKKRKQRRPQDNEAAEPEDAATAGMSSKKRKRFESFMAKKLKTEQRYETLKLLQSLAPSASTSASLASAASLGQYPLNPISAQERQDKREDKLVRNGIERLTKRFGEEDESEESEEEEERRIKGKGKAKESVEVIMDGAEEEDKVATTVIPSKTELKAAAKAASRGQSKGKMPKKANWNPSLPSQKAEESSEFDSSDSANDSPDEAEPTTVKSPEPSAKAAGAKITTNPLPPLTTGGALKKSADGQIVQPRVVVRRKKPFAYGTFGRRGVDHRQESDEEQDEDEGEDDSEGGEDSDDDDSDEESDEDEEMESGEEGDPDDTDEESESEEEPESESPPKKKRSLGFKSWALKQMGQLEEPSAPDLLDTQPASTAPKTKPLPAAKAGDYIGPLGQELHVPTESLLEQQIKGSAASKARPIITRRVSVSESRMDLPILSEEQTIIESILMHPVVIICGETGSGKTTQVPQMLYEAGFGFKGSDNPGMIAVTQPRRVAAVSLAERVRSELNIPANSSLVAHQIRYSSTTSAQTAIKFMTDGVLLRELASDFLLSRYSVVVVDEAHERGVNTDVLVGVLSRVSKLREKMWREGKDVKPLRIVVMSATLRVSDFAENTTLFSQKPPVIHIAARQHPVTIHFSKKTASDYVTEAYKKVSKIHARLPPGGILVFMTGQSEIQALCRKLEKKYTKKSDGKKAATVDDTLPPDEREAEEVELGRDQDLAADVDDGAADSDPEGLDTDDEIEGIPGLEFDEPSDMPMHVLPLYSLLPNDQQMLVFKPPPEDHRLVIISTNVAETSLTIPGIRYVVDSGRAKERHYDASNGVQSFQVSWVSKASASQRAGRAGRTGPGHCYRLYSSALFEDHFEQFSKPEILRMPIEGVVLQMKSMNIDAVINFPFPTPPDRLALRRAEDLLTNLGALSLPIKTRMVNGIQHVGAAGGQITDLGKAMAGFPVSPRFAKMLAIGTQHNCLPYVIAIVAGMSVGDPFLHEQTLEADEEEDEAPENRHIRSEEIRAKEQRKETRSRFFKAHQQFMALGQGASDMFKLLAVIGAYEYSPSASFCTNNFVRLKAMQEIHQLRAQISSIAQTSLTKITPPSDTQLKVLRQILAAGFIDQVAVREDIVLKKGVTFESTRGVPYRAVGLGSEAVFIHPGSSLFHHTPPEFVVFSEVVRTSKPWMRNITKINPAWLPSLGKSLCTFSRPMEMPTKGMGKRVGENDNEREVFVTPHFKDLGVDLPVQKKKQRREGTRWVLVD
ncbi:hypothetical protein IAR50_000415 [Cryptococcus sp. DSM 104548]